MPNEPGVCQRQSKPSSLQDFTPVIPGAEMHKIARRGSRLGWGISLFIHLLLFLFAVMYVIEQREVTDSAIAVNVLQQHQQRPKPRRRTMPRLLQIQPPPRAAQSVPRLSQVPTTAAQVPLAPGEPTLPVFTPPSFEEGLNDGAPAMSLNLERRAMALVHPVRPIRSPISTASTEPPRLEISTQTSGLGSEALELKAIDSIPPITPLSEATRLPRFINKVIPRYPDQARRAGKEGVVILEAEIGPDGMARNIKVIQGIGYGCDEAAVAALRASRFFPAYKGKRPVTVRIQIPYRFELEEM